MSLRFAPARSVATSPVARCLTPRAVEYSANDNGENGMKDEHLTAALRLFAEHGLGAAREARTRAEAALFAGDRGTYDHWLKICRVLDRRMAAELAQGSDSKSA